MKRLPTFDLFYTTIIRLVSFLNHWPQLYNAQQLYHNEIDIHIILKQQGVRESKK